MSTLLAARDLSKSFASDALFTGVSLQLVEGDRLGMIGPNGAGKSTLLRIIAGLESPDSGEITSRKGLRLVYVAQDDRFSTDSTPLAEVAAEVERDPAPHELDAWTRASITLSKLGFDNFEQPIGTLSGGWRKRLSIACALATEPDALLLDEPTNHLDLEGVLWLEKFVQQARMAIVFVTHDRRFLENTAKRIIELSPAYPGGIFEVAGNYSEFVRRKEQFLDSQLAAESAIANKVRRDTAWLLQGVKARRTRNQSQVQAADERREELKAIEKRNEAPTRTTAIDFQATERKTNKLLTLHNVGKSMGGKTLFRSLDLMLSPGRRIGLLGVNGSGKTTLLRLMSGDLAPEEGTIKPAVDLRVVTFTQHRESLVPTMTLQEALCPVGETVHYRGKPMHVTGWAKKFLFAPSQLCTFVSHLSGGEKARVLIANLMLKPADVLLLDEPTNDLDIPSLEVLEQALMEFPGAILLVTHDRFMLERVSTEFLALDGKGGARLFQSLDQWRQSGGGEVGGVNGDTRKSRAPEPSKNKPISKKLSYKHQRDLDGMEEAILKAEQEVERLEARAADSAIATDHEKLTGVYNELSQAQQRVQQLYERWAELEAMQQG